MHHYQNASNQGRQIQCREDQIYVSYKDMTIIEQSGRHCSLQSIYKYYLNDSFGLTLSTTVQLLVFIVKVASYMCINKFFLILISYCLNSVAKAKESIWIFISFPGRHVLVKRSVFQNFQVVDTLISIVTNSYYLTMLCVKILSLLFLIQFSNGSFR